MQGVVITGHDYFPAVFCIDGRDITHFALDEQHRASPCAGMLRPFGAVTISIAGHLISFKQLQGVVITGHNYFPAVFCIDARDITHFALDEQHRASPLCWYITPLRGCDDKYRRALISFKQLQGVVITGHNYFPAVFCIDGHDITHFALDEQPAVCRRQIIKPMFQIPQ